MLCALFCALSLAHDFEIQAQQFVSQNLNNGDTLFINAKDLALWIRIAPYFYYGKMTLTVVRDNITNVFEPAPGGRYYFNDVNVTITYTQASAPTSVSVWLLPEKLCSEYSFHTRNQRSVEIAADATTASGSFFLCYFIEFQKEATLTVVTPPQGGQPEIELYNSDADGVPVKMKVTNESYPVTKMSMIHIFHARVQRVEMRIDSNVFYADWSDHEGPFLDCATNVSECKSHEFDSGLKAHREIVWWIWVTIIGALVIVMVFLTILLFQTSLAIEREYSMGTGVLATVPAPYT